MDEIAQKWVKSSKNLGLFRFSKVFQSFQKFSKVFKRFSHSPVCGVARGNLGRVGYYLVWKVGSTCGSLVTIVGSIVDVIDLQIIEENFVQLRSNNPSNNMRAAWCREQAEVLSGLVEVSARIRERWRMIKAGKDANEEAASEMLKPIVNPLKELVHTSKQQIKQETKMEPLDLSLKTESKPLYFSSGNGKSDEEEEEEEEEEEWASAYGSDDAYRGVDTMEVDEGREDEDEDNSEDDDGDDTLVAGETSSTDTRKDDDLVWRYLKMFETQEQRDLDNIYGVRKLLQGMMIGSSRIKFAASGIYVGDEYYTTTPGLLELLFKKVPDVTLLTDKDRQNYAKIVMETNVLRKHYKPDGMLRANDVNPKYKYYIARYVESALEGGKSGGRLPEYKIARAEGQEIKYVRWNDPNALVDRLRLLMQSQAAGDTTAANEIVSIIEELREAKIIY